MKVNLLWAAAIVALGACSASDEDSRVVGELASDRIELTAEFSEPIVAIEVAVDLDLLGDNYRRGGRRQNVSVAAVDGDVMAGHGGRHAISHTGCPINVDDVGGRQAVATGHATDARIIVGTRVQRAGTSGRQSDFMGQL